MTSESDPAPVPVPAVEEGPKPSSFYASLPGAFVFPFRKMGWAIIVGGTLAFTMADWAGTINSLLFRAIAAALRLILGLYVCAYMISIIAEAADGEDAPPDWPSVTDLWSDILAPLLHLAGTALVSFGPLLLYVVYADPNSAWDLKLWLLVALGATYLPMGLIAVALYKSIGALNPVTIIGGIVKTVPAYLVAVVVFFAVFALNVTVHALIAGASPLGVSPLIWVVSLYFLMVGMYILGRLYYTHAKRLGWFE
ncbi:MAG: hypothetical protein ACYS5V_09535 [Planctomycetota bacterium]|jgi:hypothetical protein